MRLNQVVAIQGDVKALAEEARKEGLANLKVADLFVGHRKTYVPKDSDSDEYPPDIKNVQARVDEVLHEVAYDYLQRYLDIEAQMTWANADATADVEVDGVLLLEKAPSTYLIFLENRLRELGKLIEAAPILDPAQDWNDQPNRNTGLWETAVIWKNKGKKVKDRLELYPATDKHPAQVQVVDVDKVEGKWEEVNLSGALQQSRKRVLEQRVTRLQEAVKRAREQANLVDAPEREVGKKVLDYLLAE